MATISNSSQDTPIHFNLWNEYAIKIKQLVLRQFNHGNEGVTISLCKYVQTVIQIQSFSHPQSQPGSHVRITWSSWTYLRGGTYCFANLCHQSLGLNSLPQSHPYLSLNILQQEADRLLQDLLSTIRRPNMYVNFCSVALVYLNVLFTFSSVFTFTDHRLL